MKVLIVVHKFNVMPFMRYELPLGLAYISAVLKKAGHTVDTLNLNEYYSDVRCNEYAPLKMLLERRFRQYDFDVVCTGGLSPFFDTLQQVAVKAQEIKPGVVTIIGGGIVTSEPELIMEHTKFDFGVLGEGEETIVELIAEIEGSQRFDNVRGIIYRDQGALVKTEPRPLIMDLDSIPYPDFDGLNVKCFLDAQLPSDMLGVFKHDNPRMLPILASRSCPFKCSFCFHPVGDKYRVRSLDSIFAELDYLVAHYDINTLLVMDELFGFNRTYLLAFCERFKSYGLDLVVQLHVSQADVETINALKEAGCIFISYGLESASDTVLKSMRKNSTVAQIENALELTRQAAIQIQGNFIFGDRSETDETVAETLNWWLNHREYTINLGILMAFPGSALWSDGISRGLIKDKIASLFGECATLFRLNLTQMSDQNWEHLLRTIRHFDFNLRIQGKVLSCRTQGFNYRKRRLYTLTVECPHCTSTVHYHNMHSPWLEEVTTPFTDIRIGCRVCNQRFDILPYRVEEIICDMLEKTTGKRIGIFSTSADSVNLLKFSKALRERISCILDNNFHYGLQEIEGVPVLPLFNNLKQIEQQLDVVVLPSEQISNEYIDDLLFLEQQGVILLSIGHQLRIPELKTTEDAAAYSRVALESAQTALSSGDIDAACSTTLTLVALFPFLAEGHAALALAMEAKGDQAIALDAWHTAILMAPDNVWILEQLCRFALTSNKYDDAASAFDRLLLLAPESKMLSELLNWHNQEGHNT